MKEIVYESSNRRKAKNWAFWDKSYKSMSLKTAQKQYNHAFQVLEIQPTLTASNC